MKVITTLGSASSETKGDAFSSQQLDGLAQKIIVFVNGLPFLYRSAPPDLADNIRVADIL